MDEWRALFWEWEWTAPVQHLEFPFKFPFAYNTGTHPLNFYHGTSIVRCLLVYIGWASRTGGEQELISKDCPYPVHSMSLPFPGGGRGLGWAWGAARLLLNLNSFSRAVRLCQKEWSESVCSFSRRSEGGDRWAPGWAARICPLWTDTPKWR